MLTNPNKGLLSAKIGQLAVVNLVDLVTYVGHVLYTQSVLKNGISIPGNFLNLQIKLALGYVAFINPSAFIGIKIQTVVFRIHIPLLNYQTCPKGCLSCPSVFGLEGKLSLYITYSLHNIYIGNDGKTLIQTIRSKVFRLHIMDCKKPLIHPLIEPEPIKWFRKRAVKSMSCQIVKIPKVVTLQIGQCEGPIARFIL